MSATRNRFSPFAHPRWLISVLTLASTGFAAWIFGRALFADGGGVLAVILLTLFVILFLWVSFSFWLATAGFIRKFRHLPSGCERRVCRKARLVSNVRTAILMPVYNEDPERALGRLRATYESLQATGRGDLFDFYILSDTTNPDVWLQEEACWARLNQQLNGASRIYYRHRPENTCRKAGNIADFCERWGANYRYMVVLDADSAMSGRTLVEMVRRMEEDLEIGILQAPPTPVNRISLFARCQQFAARVYGPVFLEGFAWWSNHDGNYWGHNAIIRVAPFTKHCGLSALPGAPPFGGEILSHDFVEAALMRRAGYKVCVADDLDGSYEESPPTLIDYARRDQRWCQGNLQHIRLIFSYGMPPMNRLHMSMGAMSYLSAPLWLLFIVLSFCSVVLKSFTGEGWRPIDGSDPAWVASAPLFAGTMVLLLLPKLWGYLLLLRDPAQLAACGGAVKAFVSVVIETLVSVLVAPIMMAFHVAFVVSTFLGFHVGWPAQQRDERGQKLTAAVSAHWKQTFAGLTATALVWWLAPGMLPWLSPVLGGLILSIPLSMLLSNVRLGEWLACKGFLNTPEESRPPRVLRRLRKLLAKTGQVLVPPLERLLANPALAALHRSVLLATNAQRTPDPKQVDVAEKEIAAGTPNRLSTAERKAVLSDPAAMERLQLVHWDSKLRGRTKQVAFTNR